MVSAGWAQSLVGRDWEIWWNDEEENDVKEKNDNHEDVGAVANNATIEASASEDDKGNETFSPMDIDTAPTVISEGSSAPAKPSTDVLVREEVKEDKKESQSEDGIDSDGEGSIIDDWYAGRVLSFKQKGATFQFKILFVGDENIYEMVLGQSKVRPSASGWIVSRRISVAVARRWQTEGKILMLLSLIFVDRNAQKSCCVLQRFHQMIRCRLTQVWMETKMN
jgi:hypothetical protein